MCIITTALAIYHLEHYCMKVSMLQLETTCSECRLKPHELHLINADCVGYRGKSKTGPPNSKDKIGRTKRSLFIKYP